MVFAKPLVTGHYWLLTFLNISKKIRERIIDHPSGHYILILYYYIQPRRTKTKRIPSLLAIAIQGAGHEELHVRMALPQSLGQTTNDSKELFTSLQQSKQASKGMKIIHKTPQKSAIGHARTHSRMSQSSENIGLDAIYQISHDFICHGK
mmetsp:Transcript_3794/g.7258  ORF Transcript_3794/g.7258 Transcript_3794/m.7258 type:complete len:150 (+) Transcript_3794:176-625(+)